MIPTYKVNPQMQGGCDDQCNKLVVTMMDSSNRYTHSGIVCALLPVKKYSNYDSYIGSVKKVYKGNIIRDARRSDKAGFFCSSFMKKNYLDDIYDIHTSMATRQGRPMKEGYLKTPQEMGGYPKFMVPFSIHPCDYHWVCHCGIFKDDTGHKNGNIVTNNRLLGYIKCVRKGNLLWYSMIIGHGEYRKYNVISRLHFWIMQNVLYGNVKSNDVDFVVYAGFHQGLGGLVLWKKKTLFEEGYLQT